MHEYSLACSIAEICRETADVHGLIIIERIVLAVGPLAVVHEETLRFLFDEVAQEYGIGQPELAFSFQPLRVRCRRCGSEKTIEPPELGFIEIWHNPEGTPLPTHCGDCGATEIEFPGASRFDVEGIEGETASNAAGD
jgi:Zn finger protein HypA/HybF involved in hydrogenase expression